MQKTTKKRLILVIGIVILFCAYTYLKYLNGTSKPLDPENTNNISVIIHQGSSVREISELLEEKEIIKSAWAFYWYTRFHNFDEKIVYGRFLLSPSLIVPQILGKITNPAESESVITIQEGLRITGIDKELYELGLTKENDFIKAVKNFKDYESYPFLDKKILVKLDLPLEGYLYPDTYFLDPINFKSEDLIYKCLNNFKKKITSYTFSRSLHDTITMASIIEKEISNPEDKKVIAGILWKRLDNGWKLDADATFLYQGTDAASDSPYNTRKVKGLPPGPISNPSIESIEAALSPTQTDYWFYLTTKDGKTIYSKTNEEHNTNKAKYLQ